MKTAIALLMLVVLSSQAYAYNLDLQVNNQTKIHNVLKSINQSYFENVNTITFVNSNPIYRRYIEGGHVLETIGLYAPNTIIIYVWKTYEELNLREALIHELKHHYCWQKEFYLGHEGCFLHTPIR